MGSALIWNATADGRCAFDIDFAKGVQPRDEKAKYVEISDAARGLLEQCILSDIYHAKSGPIGGMVGGVGEYEL